MCDTLKNKKREKGGVGKIGLSICFGLLLSLGACSPAIVQHQEFDETIYVDANGPSAGSTEYKSNVTSFRSLGDAVNYAVANKKNRKSTRLVVKSGVYREGPIEFAYVNYPSNDPTNDTPILIEAEEAGKAIISGSDIWTDWEPVNDNLYRHVWPFKWGVVENPWKKYREVQDIVLRREMIFVDGKLLDQVLSRNDLKPGSFYVDESRSVVLMHPPAGTDMQRSTVEVGVRDALWKQHFENYVTIRGLTFEHAVTPWKDAAAAVWIGASKHVVLEDVEVRWSNWQGLYLGESDDVTLKRVRLNNHGGQGWGMFRNKNIIVEDSETSFNNWRGMRGAFTGWSVGNKMLSIHGLTIRRHQAKGNYSRGLWLDYDIADVRIEDAALQDNLLDGLWLEAGQGPVVIKGNQITGNKKSGILTTYSRNVTIIDNYFSENGGGHIVFDGAGRRIITNFESKKKVELTPGNWRMTGNQFRDAIAFKTGASLRRADWQEFQRQLESNQNFWPATNAPVVQIFDEQMTLKQWRQKTGKDVDYKTK